MSIIQVVEKATSEWMNIEGVEGVAQSQDGDQDSIMVLISRSKEEMLKVLPKSYEGYPVELLFTSQIDAQKHGLQEE